MFLSTPSGSTGIHHIIFANNIANGCQAGGFVSYDNKKTLASVDYFNVIGNIAYNASQGSSECFSGISVFQPVESDSLSDRSSCFAWH